VVNDATKAAPMANHLYIAYVISTYWVVSISMVYLNKILLSSENASIPAPLFVTWYQCVLTCIICKVLGNMGESTRFNGTDSFLNQFPIVSYKFNTGMQVLPLSLIFVGMITFNNICLQLVQVSFYNVARCLSLVFNVIMTYMVLGQTTSALTCATLLVVVFGFLCGIQGEIDFSLVGTSAGVLASLFVSLNSIYTSKVLPKVDNDKSMLLYYNNLNACVLFVPLIFLFESHILMENVERLTSGLFWASMSVTGAMGFAIGLVTVMQVKATSPLTHNISGTAKAAVQSLMAFYIWGNEATVAGVAGIFLVIFGSGLYTWVQMNASKPVTKPQEKASK
jgi:GDP-fucose transporter C1